MGKIFISYARGDDEPFVQMLHDSLVEEGLDAWFDRTRMESRGLPFLLEIREAIWESERVVAVIGPAALKSPYFLFELRCACHFSKVVVPVLRKGSFRDLSKKQAWPKRLLNQDLDEYLSQSVVLEDFDFSGIAKLHCLDFRKSRPYEQALSELFRILSAEIRPLARIQPGKPDLPEIHLPRVRQLSKLRDLVVRNFMDKTSIPIKNRVTAIHGGGGSGKTVLAAAFVHSTTPRRIFQDGVFWLQAGQEPDLLNEFKKIGNAFHDTSHYNSVELAHSEVQHMLSNRCCLLVIDDVWESSHAKKFLSVLGGRCSLLITTRKKGIGRSIGGRIMKAAELQQEQALQLLADWSGYSRTELPAVAKIVAKKCNFLPLPLAICGTLVAGGEISWKDLPEALDQAEEKLLEADFPIYLEEMSNISVFTPIKVSLDFIKKLDEREKRKTGVSLDRYRRYLDLAVLPLDRRSPEKVVLTLWLTRSTVQNEKLLQKVLARLNGRALLELFGDQPPLRDVLLHHLKHVYLRITVGDADLRVMHARIAKMLIKWWPRQAKERGKAASHLRKYCLHFLLYHIIHAKLWNDLGEMLGNVQFLRKKQKPEHQEKLQTEITALLRSDDVSDAELAEVFSSVKTAIVKRLKTSNEKADWLDTFAYWIYEFGIKTNRKRAKLLRPVARDFDQCCGEVAGKLACTRDDINEALRFAELKTWVYQRSGFWEQCAEACKAATEICEQDGVEEGYRKLGPVEFTRLRAIALSVLGASKKKAANLAYCETAERFATVGALGWVLGPDQWRSFERDKPRTLERFQPESRDHRTRFRARLVSNAHDCVGAIFILQFLESLGGNVHWVHYDKFKSDKLGNENLLFTIIIGGPKAPGSRIASAFYRVDRRAYLRMYSGLHFESTCLRLEEKGTHCYWLGGVSKIHTIKAAFDFAKDPKVKQLIDNARSHP